MASGFDHRTFLTMMRELLGRTLRERKHSFVHHVLHWKFLAALMILLLISYEFSHIWVVRYASFVGHDALLSVASPSISKYCQIITISEEEYDQLFGSCLPPEKLSSLIKSVLRFEPSVLAIDIDTSAPRFRDLALPETKTRIVWARAARNKGQYWVPGAVLGHRTTDPPYSGVALFPMDPDSTIRGFQRWVAFSSVNSPSFHWRVLQAYCDSGSARACEIVRGTKENDTSVRELDYHFRFPPVPVSDVVSSATRGQQNILRGKAVILGAGESDRHLTPFGVMSGAEITGTAIETEMELRQYRKLGDFGKLGIKVILALILALIFHFLKPPVALVATLGLLAATVVGTFFVYYYASLLIDFVPFLVGVWIEQLYDSAERG